MKRRGVLGFLGGAVVAGPGMARAAAAQGMEALSLPGIQSGIGAAYGGFVGGDTATGPWSSGEIPPTDPGHWVQRQLSEFMGQTAEDLARMRQQTYVQSLDPDLAVSRSFSLDAKVRMQRDRNFAINREAQRQSIVEDIRRAIKNWSERSL